MTTKNPADLEDRFKAMLKQIPPSLQKGDLVTNGQIANAIDSLRGKKPRYQELSQEEIRTRLGILEEAYGKRAIIRATYLSPATETEGILWADKFIHFDPQGTVRSQTYFSPIEDLILKQKPTSPGQAYIFEAEKRHLNSKGVRGLAELVAKYYLYKAGVVAKLQQE